MGEEKGACERYSRKDADWKVKLLKKKERRAAIHFAGASPCSFSFSRSPFPIFSSLFSIFLFLLFKLTHLALAV